MSLSVEKSNLELQTQQPQTSASALATTTTITSAPSQKTSKPETNENENEEEWLHYYMMGKIKEKLNKNSVMESLNYYLKVKFILKKVLSFEEIFNLMISFNSSQSMIWKKKKLLI